MRQWGRRASVERIRLEPRTSTGGVAEVRGLAASARSRARSTWWVGERSTPAGLADTLAGARARAGRRTPEADQLDDRPSRPSGEPAVEVSTGGERSRTTSGRSSSTGRSGTCPPRSASERRAAGAEHWEPLVADGTGHATTSPRRRRAGRLRARGVHAAGGLLMGGADAAARARARRLHLARPRALATTRSSDGVHARARSSAPGRCRRRSSSGSASSRIGSAIRVAARTACSDRGHGDDVEAEPSSSGSRSSRTRSATSSTRGRCRTRSTRSRSPAPRAATSGTTTASATSTSPRSSSTSRSATATRRSSRRSRSRRRRSRRSARRWRPSRARGSASCSPRSRRATSTMSFFTNGGTEANENAIKLARWYTGRHKIIARYRSYHGATGGSITLTGDPRRWPAEPGIPGVVRMFDPYTYRCPAGHPDPCPVCTGAPHLEEILHVRGRAHGRRRDPRDGHRDERDHPAARRLPPVDPRGLRPPRDPADRRRGDGRLRPHRQVVRGRQLGRRPRHPHGREGDQLGLRPARRDDRAASRSRSGCARASSPAA